MKTSEKGVEFLKGWEAFFANLYNDSEGHCTIGYGHLVHYGNCNGSESEEFKKDITKERAMELLKLELTKVEKAIYRDVSVDLYQHEFDALVSLLFNAGENFLNVGGKNKGETQLKKKLNNKNYEETATEFLDITNNKTSGLVKRRKSENEMFLNNIYNSTH